MKRAVAVCLLLTACAGPRRDIPTTARVTPPAAWRDTVATDAQVPVRWWTGFGDPVLNGLVDRALTNNSDIATAAARVEEAQAGFAAARGALLPALNADTGGANSRTINAFGQPSAASAGQAELTAAYEIDLFGRLRNASAAARAILLASRYAQDTVRLGVAASVASGYITLRAYDARLTLLHETVATRQQALAAATHRAQAGYSPALERQQAQAEYDGARQQIPAMQLAIRRQEDALSLLLGDSPRAINRGAGLDRLTPSAVGAQIPARVLRQRPDIAQAEQQLVAADRSLDVARAAFLPTIRLSASAGYATSTALPHGYDVYSFGGSVLEPLFQGGRLRAQTDAATARRDQAAFAYRRAALNAFREVEDGLAAVARTDEQTAIARDQVATLSETYRLASNRYRAGYSPYLEQIDAQRALLSAQLALIQVRADRLTAEVSLYQALGGGVTDMKP